MFKLSCFFVRLVKLTSAEQVSFKNRNRFKKVKVKLNYGNIGIAVLKNVQFEFIYFNIIKKFLKYFFKFKYSTNNYFKIWVILKANFPISRKSKNSRMGKGKGAFSRWIIKLNHGATIMEFKNVNFLRVKKLNIYWSKILNCNTRILIK